MQSCNDVLLSLIILQSFFYHIRLRSLTTEPYWSTPVAVPAKDVRIALPGDIVDAVLLPAHLHHKRILLVDLGEGADAVGREELLLIEKILEDAGQTLF